MSTVLRVNFEPVRDVLPIQKAVFPLADGNLANPLNAVALVDGEWLIVNSSYKIERATDVATLGAEATKHSWPVWNEKGRTDVQAVAERRTVLLWLGMWEFDTRIYDATAVVVAGAAITAVDQPVKVATIAIGGRNYTGLVGHGGSGDTAIVVGYVTRLPTDNGGKLRIRGGMLY
jgi:hypothetical protein